MAHKKRVLCIQSPFLFLTHSSHSQVSEKVSLEMNNVQSNAASWLKFKDKSTEITLKITVRDKSTNNCLTGVQTKLAAYRFEEVGQVLLYHYTK